MLNAFCSFYSFYIVCIFFMNYVVCILFGRYRYVLGIGDRHAQILNIEANKERVKKKHTHTHKFDNGVDEYGNLDKENCFL